MCYTVCISFSLHSIHISIYAAHLYDSVMLYARALHALIEEQKSKGLVADVNALARDGILTDSNLPRM